MSNLPLRQDWRYRPWDIATTVLQPNETRTIIDLRKHGWVVVGGIFCNNPNLRWVIELETGTEVYRNEFSLLELNTYGGNQACNSWWISLFDVVNGLYATQFSPAQPWPFYKRFKFSLQNPTALPITVFRVAVLAIEFIEMNKS